MFKPKHSIGMTLIELLFSLALSMLITSGIFAIYQLVKTNHVTQSQLLMLEENQQQISNIFRQFFVRSAKNWVDKEMKSGSDGVCLDRYCYFVSDTGRKVFALYRRDERGIKTELVEGVNDMKINYTLATGRMIGLSIWLEMVAVNLHKEGYVYVALHE